MFQVVIINDRKLLLAVKSGNERVCAIFGVHGRRQLSKFGGGGGGGLNDWGWVREGACPVLQPERGFGGAL